MFFKLVSRELLRSWKFGLFFIFNLSLGLTGFVSLEAFKSSLQGTLNENAKSILSADIAVSARREFTEQEREKIAGIMNNHAEFGQTYEFFAMMNSAKGSRLVMVRAVDENYPLYGELVLESGRKITQKTQKEILQSPRIWMYPEFKAQMNLAKGDEVQIGQLKLTIDDFVEKDGTQTFRGAGLAPRVFINRSLLPQSGLIQFGSTYSVSLFYKLKDENLIELKKQELLTALTDPAVQIETSKTAGEDSGRQLGYLSDYLGLVAIIALFMSSLGAAYLFRLFLTQRMREVAILRSLGLQSPQAVALYATQVAVLGFLSIVPTVLAASVIIPLLSKLLASLTPFSLSPVISLRAIGVALLLGVLGSLIISLPFLTKLKDLQPTKLFAEEKFAADVQIQKPWVFLPAILMFWLLAVVQSNSIKMGSLFVGAFFAVLLVLYSAGFLLLWLLRSAKSLKSWITKYSLLGLSRRRSSSLAIFVALGLGSLLINILPQLKVSLQNEFKVEEVSKVPSLFLFDIQDDQVPKVKEILAAENVQMLGLSPLIRARILKVNGHDFERKIEPGGFRTREEEAEARFRNRGVNLSYREDLSNTENITEGRPFSGTFDPNKQKYPELSVEYRYAERLGLKLNDVLVFDVQGVEIEGQVINFRKVKWTSFQPNFFILVQNGVLNEAPKTFITAVPKIPDDKKNQLQGKIAQALGNVSVIDVQRTVNEVLKIADQMSWSLELMAALALLTGYIVLYSIVSSQVRLRRWELNMFKVMGAKFAWISEYIMNEFLVLSFGAALVGAGLSVVVSFFISYYVFEGSFVLSWHWPVISVIGVCLISVLVAYWASRRVVQESPLVILQNND